MGPSLEGADRTVSGTRSIPDTYPHSQLLQERRLREELERFLVHEKELVRSDLILPVYYIDYPPLNSAQDLEGDKLVRAIAERQYADWRKLRFKAISLPEVGEAIAKLAVQIRDAIGRPTPLPGTTLNRSAPNTRPGLKKATSRAKRRPPGAMRNPAVDPVVATFVRRLKAVTEKLRNNTLGSRTSSAWNILRSLESDPDFRLCIQESKQGQALRLLLRQFSDLFDTVGNFQSTVSALDENTVAPVFADALRRLATLAREYMTLVAEFLDLMKTTKGSVDPPPQNRGSWSFLIYDDLSDDYDRLMTLLMDLKSDTPADLAGHLLSDDDLRKFPRVTLLR